MAEGMSASSITNLAKSTHFSAISPSPPSAGTAHAPTHSAVKIAQLNPTRRRTCVSGSLSLTGENGASLSAPPPPSSAPGPLTRASRSNRRIVRTTVEAAGARLRRNSTTSPPMAVMRQRIVAITAHSPTARERRRECKADVGGRDASVVSTYWKPHIVQCENPRSPTLTARHFLKHSRCTKAILPAHRHGAKRSDASCS
mmetsp:Transcript_43462/g.103324  ORF Transcript_43462/g.103324 Transcript_43462/m.103324 type:complete len:200 (-) Transcript_43462:109-708(-)